MKILASHKSNPSAKPQR